MGSCKFDACEECSQKCMLVHGNKDPSPIVSSFFKVLVPNRFLTSLIIPPRFARSIKSLVNQKIDLEDSKGRRWKVQVSSLNDHLVFRQGWSQFASDHSLEHGEFLVFSYLLDSHFVVQIYCKSGCEKLDFSKRVCDSTGSSSAELSSDHLTSDSKSSTPAEASSPMIDSIHSNSGDDTTKSDSDPPSIVGKPVSTEKAVPWDDSAAKSKPVLPNNCTEVPFYMIGRDLGVQEVNRSSLFDLSDFEMVNDRPGVGGKDKGQVVTKSGKFSHAEAESVQPQTQRETDLIEERCNIIKSVETKKSCGGTHDVSGFKEPTRRCHSGDRETLKDKMSMSSFTSEQLDPSKKRSVPKDKISTSSDAFQLPQTRHSPRNEMVNVQKSNGGFRTRPLLEKRKSVFSGIDRVSQMKFDILAESSGTSLKIVKPDFGNDPTIHGEIYLPGKKLTAVKEHSKKVEEKHGRKPPIVKTELEVEDYPSFKVQRHSSKVVKTEIMESSDLSPLSSAADAVTHSFLEFPTNSPTIFCIGRMKNTDRKIVLIRDPAERVWPVLYHQKMGFKVLVAGWAAIGKANQIRQGDRCVFEVEDKEKSLFRLRIVRN